MMYSYQKVVAAITVATLVQAGGLGIVQEPSYYSSSSSSVSSRHRGSTNNTLSGARRGTNSLSDILKTLPMLTGAPQNSTKNGTNDTQTEGLNLADFMAPFLDLIFVLGANNKKQTSNAGVKQNKTQAYTNYRGRSSTRNLDTNTSARPPYYNDRPSSPLRKSSTPFQNHNTKEPLPDYTEYVAPHNAKEPLPDYTEYLDPQNTKEPLPDYTEYVAPHNAKEPLPDYTDYLDPYFGESHTQSPEADTRELLPDYTDYFTSHLDSANTQFPTHKEEGLPDYTDHFTTHPRGDTSNTEILEYDTEEYMPEYTHLLEDSPILPTFNSEHSSDIDSHSVLPEPKGDSLFVDTFKLHNSFPDVKKQTPHTASSPSIKPVIPTPNRFKFQVERNQASAQYVERFKTPLTDTRPVEYHRSSLATESARTRHSNTQTSTRQARRIVPSRALRQQMFGDHQFT